MKDWVVKTAKDPLYPHIIIDNWYTEKELENVWKELDFYCSQDIINIDKAENTIVAKDKDGEAKSNAFRFYLADMFTIKGATFSHILKSLYKQKSEEFKEIVLKAMPLHHNNYINTNTDSSMVSYYDHGQEYKSHKDSTQFTFVIWLFKEPKKFKGGDFCFTEAKQTIKCVSNRMVMFPSYLGHQVYSIKMDKDAKFGDGRYCVTHFFNWESTNEKS
tara:strand:- start:682 stop:1332 length:651 start_codon:yes stop_codon:yes gene_type:complete